MRYALMICGDEATVRGEDPERDAAYRAFMEHLGERLLYGLRLRPTDTATTVQVRNGEMVIADGPFAETKEQIGGFFIVECANLDEAIEAAARIPGAQTGSIEVRPIWEV